MSLAARDSSGLAMGFGLVITNQFIFAKPEKKTEERRGDSRGDRRGDSRFDLSKVNPTIFVHLFPFLVYAC